MYTVYTYTYTHADHYHDGGQYVSSYPPLPSDFEEATADGLILTVTEETYSDRKAA